MALRKKNDPATVETSPETLAARAEAQIRQQAEQAAPTPEPVTTPVQEPELVQEPVITTEVATKAPASLPGKTVSAATLMKQMLYSGLENGFVAEFGTLPRLIASNGNIMDDKKAVLGAFVTGQVLSWNKRWTITPADDKAPNTLCAFSMDNVTIDDGSGTTVAQYILDLKANGWPDACSKEYYDVVFSLQSAEKGSPLVGGLVTIQLSPTSRVDFDNFRLQTSFRIANGLVPAAAAELLKLSAEPVTGKNGKTWTKFNFSLA